MTESHGPLEPTFPGGPEWQGEDLWRGIVREVLAAMGGVSILPGVGAARLQRIMAGDRPLTPPIAEQLTAAMIRAARRSPPPRIPASGTHARVDDGAASVNNSVNHHNEVSHAPRVVHNDSRITNNVTVTFAFDPNNETARGANIPAIDLLSALLRESSPRPERRIIVPVPQLTAAAADATAPPAAGAAFTDTGRRSRGTPTGPAPDPRSARTTGQYVDKLRDLRAWSRKSLRALENEARRHNTALPKSTLSDALAKGQDLLPALSLVNALTLACGLGPAERAVWVSVYRDLGDVRPNENDFINDDFINDDFINDDVASDDVIDAEIIDAEIVE